MRTRNRKRNRKTKRQRTRNRKGGVLFFQTAVQDIMPELQRFADGTVTFVNSGGNGYIIELKSDESTVFKSERGGINSILVKMVSIDGPYRFVQDGEEIENNSSSAESFEQEVHLQDEIRDKSVKRFNGSIIPSILHADIYTQRELDMFPKIKAMVKMPGRVGLIFMEHILNTDKLTAANLASYYFHPPTKDYTIQKLFPRARRVLIMLAQLGFLSNDFNPGNILVTGNVLLIIDVAKATRIPEEKMAEFQSYLDRGDASNLLKFLYGNVPYVAETEEDKTDEKYLDCQWLGQNQIDTYVEGINPTVLIVPESYITDPLRLTEEQKALCLNPTKINYVEKEAAKKAEREAAMAAQEAARIERIAREADAEAARRKAYEAEREKETPEQRAAAQAAQDARDAAFAAEYGYY